MRLTLALTALGLTIRHVAGQQQWQDFGAIPEFMKQSFYNAVARSPTLAKRDGDCPVDRHPCEQHPSSHGHKAVVPPK